MKKQNKKYQNARCIDEKLKAKSRMFFVSFFHVICKISYFNKWTATKVFGVSFLYWVDFKQVIFAVSRKMI